MTVKEKKNVATNLVFWLVFGWQTKAFDSKKNRHIISCI